MASINDLPTELVDKIFHELQEQDALSLSAVNRRFRAIGLPYLLESVTLPAQDFTQVMSVLPIIGHQVRDFQVTIPPATCELQGCPKCTTAAQTEIWDEQGVALAFLRGNHDNLLPNMRKITIKLPTDFGKHVPYDSEDIPRDLYQYLDENDAEAVINDAHVQIAQWSTISSRVHRRANAAFTALAQRGDRSAVKHLAVVNLSPMCQFRHMLGCSTIGNEVTPAWRKYLGSLERFDLSLWGGPADYKGPDWAAWWRHETGADRYDEFTKNLAQYTFDLLSSVKHVRLECSGGALLGYDEVPPLGPYRDLPFIRPHSAGATMPLLKTLELVNIMVDSSLLDFIVRRGERPPLALTLEDCRVNWQLDYGDNFGRWSKVLNRLKDMITEDGGPRLSAFELLPRADPQTEASSNFGTLPLRYAMLEEGDDNEDWAEWDDEEWPGLEWLKKRPEGRQRSYWKGMYVTTFEREEDCPVSVEAGEREADWNAYIELMDAIALFNAQ